MVSTPKSTPKLAEDEMHIEEISKTTSKRKRRLGQEKVRIHSFCFLLLGYLGFSSLFH